MTATLAGMCLAIVAASVLGGLLPTATVLTHTRLQIYLSFAAGSMLGAAFFHMMPEAVELGSAGTLRWSAFGLIALFLLERFFAYHHHEAPADPTEPCPHVPHTHSHDHGAGHAAGLVDAGVPTGLGARAKASSLHWGAAAFGLAVHTLVGGVALASAAGADQARHGAIGPSTLGVFLATLLHKPADALTIVSLMLRAGVPRSLTRLVNLGFALMIPLGALGFLLSSRYMAAGSPWFTDEALAFSAGTFLCIALSDLLPELHFHEHDRVKLTLALLAGFVLMAGASAWEHGNGGHDHGVGREAEIDPGGLDAEHVGAEGDPE